MRRKDRQMDAAFGLQIIDKAAYAVVSVVDELGCPYSIPISPVRIGDVIYFHSAQGGRKVELFTEGKPMCMVFVGEVQVPELYSEEELKVMEHDELRATELTRRVFTTEYESAIVKGKILKVQDEEERAKAFRAISMKYCPSKERLIDSAIRAGGGRAFIYAVGIDELTAKRKKYDASGEEIKSRDKV